MNRFVVLASSGHDSPSTMGPSHVIEFDRASAPHTCSSQHDVFVRLCVSSPPEPGSNEGPALFRAVEGRLARTAPPVNS